MKERQGLLETGPYMPGPSGKGPSLAGHRGQVGGPPAQIPHRWYGCNGKKWFQLFREPQTSLVASQGPAIPGVGTASPLAATATILQSFPRKNLWFSVVAGFAAGHNCNAQTC